MLDTIRLGDNLYRISLRFGTAVPALMSLNGITDPNRIIAGQTICVKPGGGVPWGFLYTIGRRDTLRPIGSRFGRGVWYLASVNHIPNPDVIRAGRVILIPYH